MGSWGCGAVLAVKFFRLWSCSTVVVELFWLCGIEWHCTGCGIALAADLFWLCSFVIGVVLAVKLFGIKAVLTELFLATL